MTTITSANIETGKNIRSGDTATVQIQPGSVTRGDISGISLQIVPMVGKIDNRQDHEEAGFEKVSVKEYDEAVGLFQRWSSKNGSSTDIFMIMALAHKMGVEMKKSGKEQRLATLEGQISALKNAADSVRDAAEKVFQAAIISGSVQIGVGALQVGGGVAGGVKAAKAAKAMKAAKPANAANKTEVNTATTKVDTPTTKVDTATTKVNTGGPQGPKVQAHKVEAHKGDTGPEIEAPDGKTANNSTSANVQKNPQSGSSESAKTVADSLNAQSQSINNISMGIGPAGTGMGQIFSAQSQKEGSEHEAVQKEHEADASRIGAVRDTDQEHIQNLQELLKDIRDRLAAMEESDHQTHKSILRI